MGNMLAGAAAVKALVSAVERGDVYTMEQCFNKGVSRTSVVDGMSLVQVAIAHSQERGLDHLLRSGAPPHHVTKDGRNALHFAVQVASLRMVRALLAAGVNVWQRDGRGRRPYDLALAVHTKGITPVARVLEARMCPFRGFIWFRDDPHQGDATVRRWVVVDRAGIGAPRNVPRAAVSMLLFWDAESSRVKTELRGPKLVPDSETSVFGDGGTVSFRLVSEGHRTLHAQAPAPVFEWLNCALDDSFPTGSNPIVGPGGVVIVPPAALPHTLTFGEEEGEIPLAVVATTASAGAGASSTPTTNSTATSPPRRPPPTVPTALATPELPATDPVAAMASAPPLDHHLDATSPPPGGSPLPASMVGADPAAPSDPSPPPPAVFLCPITLELMEEPVVASDGFSYEKAAISTWLEGGNDRSPTTNAPLPDARLVPNNALRSQILEWKDAQRRSSLSPTAAPAALS